MTRFVRSYGIALAVAATILGSAAGCGGSDASLSPATASSPAQAPQPQVHSQSLDTAEVLEQARHPSETADPYAVNSGALTLTDTGDSTDPLVVVAL